MREIKADTPKYMQNAGIQLATSVACSYAYLLMVNRVCIAIPLKFTSKRNASEFNGSYS